MVDCEKHFQKTNMQMALRIDYFRELVREQNFLELEQIDGSQALIPGQAYLFIEHYYRVIRAKYPREQPMIAGYYQPGSYLEKTLLNCGGMWLMYLFKK